jgi:hypothetical protein
MEGRKPQGRCSRDRGEHMGNRQQYLGEMETVYIKQEVSDGSTVTEQGAVAELVTDSRCVMFSCSFSLILTHSLMFNFHCGE